MDGLSLCSKLRQDLETCHIPIILLTAQPSTGHSLESIAGEPTTILPSRSITASSKHAAATCWRTGSECA